MDDNGTVAFLTDATDVFYQWKRLDRDREDPNDMLIRAYDTYMYLYIYIFRKHIK